MENNPQAEEAIKQCLATEMLEKARAMIESDPRTICGVQDFGASQGREWMHGGDFGDYCVTVRVMVTAEVRRPERDGGQKLVNAATT